MGQGRETRKYVYGMYVCMSVVVDAVGRATMMNDDDGGREVWLER